MTNKKAVKSKQQPEPDSMNPPPIPPPYPSASSAAPRKDGGLILKIMLLTFGFAAAFVVVLVVLLRSFASYPYPARPIPELGLQATLRAPYGGGAVHYSFHAKSLPGRERDIRDALEGTDMPFHFKIELLDAKGALLCSTMPAPVHDYTLEGTVDGIRADGVFPGCTFGKFRKAVRWDLAYDIPRGEHIPTVSFMQDSVPRPVPPIPFPNGTIQNAMLRATDYLAGTLELYPNPQYPGGTYSVIDDSDIPTLRRWENGRMILNCQSQDCVLINTTAGGSVRVRKTQ